MVSNRSGIAKQVSIFLILTFALSGCATFDKALRAMFGKQNDSDIKVTTPRFSEQENLRANSDKQYKRMNRQRFEEDADLRAEAGSLWVMEGQGAYLFAQNQMRMVGDLLNVKIEGSPKSQLQTKQRVISKLLERLEGAALRGPAAQAGSADGQRPAGGAPAAGGAPDAAGGGDAGAQAAPGAQAGGKNDAGFAVQVVPTRIVEQMKDGSYRVRGMQPFMIGKREYKVIVTGIVRPEDFDDAGIDAGKLLDSQFDIVSSRKGASL